MTNDELAWAAFGEKAVVVTGAGGSIGSEISRAAARCANTLTLVSRTEASLHGIVRRLSEDSATTARLHPVLASVTDHDAMRTVMFEQDVVVHCAAHKHVPICEEHVREAVRNNVWGTYVVSTWAARHNVGRFVLVSTDKAIRPVSVMGATKRLAELIVDSMDRLHAARRSFRIARMVNVLDSSGSVLPIWRDQLRRGRKLTLTDGSCVRYFMSFEHAARTIMLAASATQAGVYVPTVQPTTMIDLARTTVWDVVGGLARDVDDHIEIVGLRPGERAMEESVAGDGTVVEVPLGGDVTRVVGSISGSLGTPAFGLLLSCVFDGTEEEAHDYLFAAAQG